MLSWPRRMENSSEKDTLSAKKYQLLKNSSNMKANSFLEGKLTSTLNLLRISSTILLQGKNKISQSMKMILNLWSKKSQKCKQRLKNPNKNKREAKRSIYPRLLLLNKRNRNRKNPNLRKFNNWRKSQFLQRKSNPNNPLGQNTWEKWRCFQRRPHSNNGWTNKVSTTMNISKTLKRLIQKTPTNDLQMLN